MLVRKVIKAKILDETHKGKLEALEGEYANFQKALRGEDAELYSATKQQAERLLRKIRKQNGGKIKQKEYPLILRNDVYMIYDIKVTDNKLSKYWIGIPVHGIRGGIKLPIKPHCEIDMSWRFKEAKVFRKKNGWFVHIAVEKEVEIKQEYNNILAIDLGIRRIATIVSTANSKPKLYGKGLRKVRGHYFYLRRKLGKLKKFKAIKKIGNKEKRVVDDLLHKISREIVNRAKEENAVIVLGDLKGIRKQDKGRKFNRKLNSFPYYRLSKLIEYKATWEGIAVIKVNEANTSKLCSRCGAQGLRHNGRFICPNCGIELNADYNGALNILKRALGYISRVGAALTQPEGDRMKLKLTNPQSPRLPTLVVESVKGMFAEVSPESVELVKGHGHEIGCHGYDHSPQRAFDSLRYEEQLEELKRAKKVIEDVAGRTESFRAPMLRINEDTVRALEKTGFKTDSSVASQRFDGPFTFGSKKKLKWLLAPRRPYMISYDSVVKEGNSDILEIPISALFIPFIGTTMRMSPLVTKMLRKFLFC